MANLHLHLSFLLLLCFFPNSQSFWWPSSSSSSSDELHGTKITEFTVQGFTDAKGVEIVDGARRKMAVPNSCWHYAYKTLFESCSEIIRDEEKKRRLAWLLSDCFQKETGRSGFPACKESVAMKQCLRKLDDGEHKTFLEFFIETNSICHQLQSETFKHETERLVNELTKSAHIAEDKLDIINEKSNQWLEDSNQIHDSLSSIHEETRQVAQTSKDVEIQLSDVLKNSQDIFQQSKNIAESQVELKESQKEMNNVVMSGMATLKESYESLGKGMDNLMMETVKIEKEVKVVGESMVSKMHELQSTADNIEGVAGSSLEKQLQLLDGQNQAIEGLDSLVKSQSEALRESRDTLEKFSEYGHRQHEELLRNHEQIRKTHAHLYQSSQAILEAQREFELKQSDIFSMLEKLYALYKAILDESRFIKAFFFYSCIITLLYMLTSAKQTFRIRALLYLGLCLTLLLEMAVIKLGNNNVIKKIWFARTTFLVAASVQILYSIFTYRDYEIISHQMLQTLLEKVCMLEKYSGNKSLCLGIDSDDDNLNDYSWIDEELPEDVDVNEDPNYDAEEVGENSITTTLVPKSYDLRPRKRYECYV